MLKTSCKKKEHVSVQRYSSVMRQACQVSEDLSSEFVPPLCTKATNGINVIMLGFNLIKKSNYINMLIELYY